MPDEIVVVGTVVFCDRILCSLHESWPIFGLTGRADQRPTRREEFCLQIAVKVPSIAEPEQAEHGGANRRDKTQREGAPTDGRSASHGQVEPDQGREDHREKRGNDPECIETPTATLDSAGRKIDVGGPATGPVGLPTTGL